MATTTPNFGWAVPTSTDLVKDGAVAIETLGDSIDASLVDLKGGTTGQVLAKATNTDMDFTWVAQDDSNAIQNAIVDAKGDIIAATADNTPARLAVGTANQVLTVDSTTATGLKWATPAASTPTYVGASVYATNVTTSFVQYANNILAFANENFDTDAFHDNATNNSRITIPTGKGGKYLINMWVRSDTTITDTFMPVLFKNGSALSGSGDGILYGGRLYNQEGLSTTSAPTQVWGNAVVALAAADYIQLTMYTRQATFNCQHYAQFSATYLGA
jgi:hypothetical protein